MWNRPAAFTCINLVTFVFLLLIYGFELAPLIALALSLFIFAYNIRFVGIFSSLCMSILYLLVFDSEAFTFTAVNVRIWYLPLVCLLAYKLASRRITVSKTGVYFLVPTLALFLHSFYYLFVEIFTFKLHIVKYWLFSVGLIYILIVFFKKHLHQHTTVLKFLFSIVGFVAIYGIIQYGFMMAGNYNLIRTTRDFRPEAFFSETTWYAELLVLGFPIAFLLKTITGTQRYLLWLPILLVGLFLSVTRNAFLGLFIFIFLEGAFQIIKARVKIRYTKNTLIAFSMAFILAGVALILNLGVIREQAEKIIGRFNIKKDASSVGRMEAFEVSFQMAKNTPLFGNGFYWTEAVKAGIANTAVGAKSFNLLFMIYHIFGPIGFFFFFLIIAFYFYLLVTAILISPNIFSRYAFYVFTIFFVMAMFAPIHQFPIGMFFVALSVFLYNCGTKWKKSAL